MKIESSDIDKAYKHSRWHYTMPNPAVKLNHKFDVISYPIGSCNGLICFIVGPGHSNLNLLNPATHEYHDITGPCHSELLEPLYWGFGYDPSSDDCKIVVLGVDKLSKTRHPFALVYRLRTSEWRRVIICPSDQQMSEFTAENTEKTRGQSSLPTLVGQNLYWRIEGKFDLKNLLAFDLTRESFEIIPLSNQGPDTNGHLCEDFFICQLRQCLCACWVWNNCFNSKYLKVWIFEGHGKDKAWTILFRLRGLERSSTSRRILPKLFELKEYRKYMIFKEGVTAFWLVDPRGELHHPIKSVDIKSDFGRFARYILDYTPGLASPTHHR